MAVVNVLFENHCCLQSKETSWHPDDGGGGGKCSWYHRVLLEGFLKTDGWPLCWGERALNSWSDPAELLVHLD